MESVKHYCCCHLVNGNNKWLVQKTDIFLPATFSGDVATFPVGSTAASFSGSVSATFSGASIFLGMRFPKNVAIYKLGYIFW